ncbi:hypothetical protein JL36_08430 [Lactococcus cremoris]|nr:hypothetical protein JL36_08430 [Lactococcus cremoris]
MQNSIFPRPFLRKFSKDILGKKVLGQIFTIFFFQRKQIKNVWIVKPGKVSGNQEKTFFFSPSSCGWLLSFPSFFFFLLKVSLGKSFFLFRFFFFLILNFFFFINLLKKGNFGNKQESFHAGTVEKGLGKLGEFAFFKAFQFVWRMIFFQFFQTLPTKWTSLIGSLLNSLSNK